MDSRWQVESAIRKAWDHSAWSLRCRGYFSGSRSWRRRLRNSPLRPLPYILSIARGYQHLSINIGDLPSQDHTAHGALHLLTFKWGPVGFREGHVAGDRPLMLQIHLSEGSRVRSHRVRPSCGGGTLPGSRPSTPHLYIGVLLERQVEDPPRVVVQSL